MDLAPDNWSELQQAVSSFGTKCSLQISLSGTFLAKGQLKVTSGMNISLVGKADHETVYDLRGTDGQQPAISVMHGGLLYLNQILITGGRILAETQSSQQQEFWGGALWNNGTVNAGTVTFADNQVGHGGNYNNGPRGGAIQNLGHLTLNFGAFVNNIAGFNAAPEYWGGRGGAIVNENTGVLDIHNGYFLNNSVGGSQGFCAGSDDCKASGGAIFNSGHVTLGCAPNTPECQFFNDKADAGNNIYPLGLDPGTSKPVKTASFDAKWPQTPW
jgi:hypothetical protein